MGSAAVSGYTIPLRQPRLTSPQPSGSVNSRPTHPFRALRAPQFEWDFERFADLVHSSIAGGLQAKYNLAVSVASAFAYSPATSSAAYPWATTWPAFDAFGSAAVALGGARAVALLPFVGAGAERIAYDAFMAASWASMAGAAVQSLSPAEQASLQARARPWARPWRKSETVLRSLLLLLPRLLLLLRLLPSATRPLSCPALGVPCTEGAARSKMEPGVLCAALS